MNNIAAIKERENKDKVQNDKLVNYYVYHNLTKVKKRI